MSMDGLSITCVEEGSVNIRLSVFVESRIEMERDTVRAVESPIFDIFSAHRIKVVQIVNRSCDRGYERFTRKVGGQWIGSRLEQIGKLTGEPRQRWSQSGRYVKGSGKPWTQSQKT